MSQADEDAIREIENQFNVALESTRSRCHRRVARRRRTVHHRQRRLDHESRKASAT